jgi:copper homeostasis protein (lipoprotein)
LKLITLAFSRKITTMSRRFFYVNAFLGLIIIIAGCRQRMPVATGTPPGIATEESALDWTGIYAGTLPCAACPGIRARLVLNENQTYLYEWSFVDAPEEHHQMIGNLVWDPEINTITLEGVDSSLLPAIYSVGPNVITQNIAGKQPDLENLSSLYFLEKLQANLFETRWVLVELLGEPIPGNRNISSSPYIIFSANNNRITGNGSCNNFFGSFNLGEDNLITISGIGATKMMCQEMWVENRFFEMLENVNSYFISGETLVLVRDGMVTAARFVASERTE